MLKNLLEPFDLTKYETSIFALLLEHSPSGAAFLAKKLGLSRSTVYTALASLQMKGLVSTTFKNEVKQFENQGIEALKLLSEKQKNRVTQQEAAIEKIEQELVTRVPSALHVPSIQIFEGEQGVERMYWSLLREARKGDTWYIIRDDFEWMPEWQFILENRWQDEKRRKDIRSKILIKTSQIEKEKQQFYQDLHAVEVRYLPQNHPLSRFSITVIGDISTIISLESGNITGIKIANEHIAKNQIALFMSLWAVGKPTP